jgi:hypothetical protein
LPVVEPVDLGMVVVVEREALTNPSTFLFRTAVIPLLSAPEELELPTELPNRLQVEIQVPLVST